MQLEVILVPMVVLLSAYRVGYFSALPSVGSLNLLHIYEPSKSQYHYLCSLDRLRSLKLDLFSPYLSNYGTLVLRSNSCFPSPKSLLPFSRRPSLNQVFLIPVSVVRRSVFWRSSSAFRMLWSPQNPLPPSGGGD